MHSAPCLVEVARIPSNEHTQLLSSKFFNDSLGAFYTINSDELCLILWKQSRPSTADDVIAFDSSPLATVSHKHSDTLLTEPFPLPPSPPPSIIVTCTSSCTSSSTSSCTSGTVISECLYSYLFSHEDLILKSPVIIYGCVCGCVLAVSLKRVHSDDQPQVICSFNEQSVISVHTCTLGGGTSLPTVHNTLVCIGSNGCVNLFVAHNSNVIQREVFVAPQLISAILVNGFGLVYSSLDTVQKICMKHQCCSSITDDSSILQVLNSSLVIVESPLLLLYMDRNIVLGVTMDGRLTHQGLQSQSPCVSMTTPTSANTVGESMKKSLRSLQTSEEILQQIDHDIGNIDECLLALNETMLLFRRLSNPGSAPIVVQTEILYEQSGIDQYSPYLQVSVSCTFPRPLRRSVALMLEVSCHGDTRVEAFTERRLSKEDTLSIYTQTMDLQGFHNGFGQLVLKPKIPFHFYQSLRLSISFYCIYNPQKHKSLEMELKRNNLKDQVGIVKICHHNLSPLQFVSAVSNVQSQKLVTRSSRTQISLNISVDSLSTFTGSKSLLTDDPSKLLEPKLLSGVLADSEIRKNKMKGFIVQNLHGIGGGPCLRVRVVCCTDLMMVQLHWNTINNHFVLTIDSSCKELAILLTDEIAQRIVTQCHKDVSDYLSVIIHKNRQVQQSVIQMQEAIVEYFHDTIL